MRVRVCLLIGTAGTNRTRTAEEAEQQNKEKAESLIVIEQVRFSCILIFSPSYYYFIILTEISRYLHAYLLLNYMGVFAKNNIP